MYEEGSLPGQIISVRKLTKKQKKSKSVKLEVPISLLKLHQRVTQQQRSSLIDMLIDGSLSFPGYCEQMEKEAGISEVQGHIEILSKEKFGDISQRFPEEFTDDILVEFDGAKVSSGGENLAYKKLVRHVNVAMSSSQPSEACHEELVKFVHTDNMNMIDVGVKMKDYDLILLHSSEDKEFTTNNEYVLIELVKQNPSVIGVIINLDEKALRKKMCCQFEDSEILVDYILFKRQKPITLNGFKKEFFSVAVFGNKTAFNLKEIKTLYSFDIKSSIPFVIGDLASPSGKVLFAFSEATQAMDLDPHGALSRKKISLSYMSGKDILGKFSSDLSKKVT